MSEAVAWAKAQQVGNPVAKAVLVCLATWADADGYCWSPVGVMAFELERSERTVQRGLSLLVSLADHDGPLKLTPRKHLREGKLLPVYQLNRDSGPSNTREALRGLRQASELGVTRVSPQDGAPGGAWGDTGVTPRGDIDDRLGVTSTTSLHLKGKVELEREHSGGCAGETDLDRIKAGFDRVWSRWAEIMPDGVAHALDLACWIAAVERMGDVAVLVGAALAYLERSPAVKGGRGKSMVRWLGEEGWRQWLPKTAAEPAVAAPVWGGDPAIREEVVALNDSGLTHALDRAEWDQAGRRVLTQTADQAQRLRLRLGGRALDRLQITITERTAP
jgi:hypothetical protein